MQENIWIPDLRLRLPTGHALFRRWANRLQVDLLRVGVEPSTDSMPRLQWQVVEMWEAVRIYSRSIGVGSITQYPRPSADLDSSSVLGTCKACRNQRVPRRESIPRASHPEHLQQISFEVHHKIVRTVQRIQYIAEHDGVCGVRSIQYFPCESQDSQPGGP